jgi:thiosulfate/3-mercaptopyruvate sulfurtransferase
METLVGPDDVASHRDDPGWVVLDCRHDLTDPSAGRKAYALGHIPGAAFLSIDEELCGPRNGRNGRHPLPDIEAVAAVFGALGIGDTTQVVAYDAQGGAFAARAWWTLRWLGHRQVAVLDGGWQRWLAEIGTTTTAIPRRAAVRFTPRAQPVNVDIVAIEANLAQRSHLLVDARAADRFRGENEKLDPVGGHVPGAVNRPYADNLAGGRFKRAGALAEEWRSIFAAAGGAGPAAAIHMCGSGVSACHNLLALEVAGLTGGKLYPGSWSEWCADSRRPVAT